MSISKRSSLALFGSLATFALPLVSLAYSPLDLASLGYDIIDFINYVLVPLIFAIAFVVFLWGVAQSYILSGGDGERRKEGHQLILWGLIGFFVMLSVWGLVNLLGGTLSLDNNAPPPPVIPYAPSSGSPAVGI